MIGLFKGVLAMVCFLRSRTFAVGTLSVVLAFTIFKISIMTNAIYIRDGEFVELKFTLKQDVENILDHYGIVTLAYDEVDFTGFQGKMAEINITRAFPVLVTADGASKTLMMTQGTVADALEEAQVYYDSNDILSHSIETMLDENHDITITRVDQDIRAENEMIPYEVVSRTTPLLAQGRTVILQSGKEGEKILTYAQRKVDGVVEEEQLAGENVVKKPVSKHILVGGNAAVSPLDFGVPIDANGVPVSYSYLLPNKIATGYSSSHSVPRGASGEKLKAGYVAVNPNIIPYGTRMYITSSDNKFVYGFAIAADTGTGLMDGIIDVDLFYDTHVESMLTGRRELDIYII